MKARLVVGLVCGVLLLAVGNVVAAGGAEPEKVARELVQNLVRGDFTAATQGFDQRMADALPSAKLAQVWRSVVAQVGAFDRVVSARTEKVQGYDVVTLTCAFAHARLDVRVAVDSASRVAGLFFLPHKDEPATEPTREPAPSGEHEIEVTVGANPWQLPGTLTLPAGKGPFPAAVLVQGSGPHDRDETIGSNRPFRDLALGLAQRGVAVLRYDKRTFHYAARIAAHLKGFTVDQETVEDARAAVALLASRPEVDPHRIVILGHSLGGYVAPRIAAGDPQVAGLVILAGSTRPMEELIVEQVKYLAALDGTVDAAEKSGIAAAEKAEKQIQDPKLTAGQTVSVLGSSTPASYWLDLRPYHPGAVAATLHIPMLILQGRRDYQVGRADFQGWKSALAGRGDVTFKMYPNLNHLFMRGSGPPSPADYTKAGHVDQHVISDIATWVKTLAR